ncbi:MAG: hypothetical protein OSA89_19495 [Mariniblastus sp.]|nr:hypothetical protein [Mariniblastus sp.]|tara:strand:- start:372 stop:536 length:165 start_codon:yes stop_codon:yes gene_type:complete
MIPYASWPRLESLGILMMLKLVGFPTDDNACDHRQIAERHAVIYPTVGGGCVNY